MKRWFGAALAATALVLLVWATSRTGAADGSTVVRVERGRLEISVEVEGLLKAAEATSLGPPLVAGMWDYKISFLAPEGSEVEAGEPVLGFDASSLERQLEDRANEGEQAATELEERRTRWERRQQELKLRLAEVEARAKKLELAVAVPAELVAALEADEKQLDRRLAERELELARQQAVSEASRAEAELAALVDRRERARARMAELERSITTLTVRAPRRGTVLYEQENGQRPKVGDSVWQGRTLLSIPDLSSLRGEGQVEETDFAALRLGQLTRLTLDAFPDEPLEATVEAIGSALRSREDGRPGKVVKVDLRLPSTLGGRARPGMRFRGQVVIDRVEGALLLPLAAVRATAAGPTVARRRPLGQTLVAVTLGRRSQEKVEVLAGLEAGDLVVLP